MKAIQPKEIPTIPIAPKALPVIGHLMQFLNNKQSLFLENAERFQSPFWINIGFNNWNVVLPVAASFQAVKDKFTSADAGLDFSDFIVTNTLLVKDGKRHRKMRGAMAAPFTPHGLGVAEIGNVISEVIDKQLVKFKAGAEISAVNLTGWIALDVIFRMLGIPNEELLQWRKKFGVYFNPIAIFIPFTFPGSPRWRAQKAAQWMDNRFNQLIEEALKKGDRNSMIGALAHGKDKEGNRLTRPELLANLRVLFLAGHETTAATMGWMLLEAARHSDIQEKLIAEASQQAQPPLSPKEMKLFPYAEGFFRECLRLYPPVGDGPRRRVKEAVEIDGHHLPIGTRVMASTFSISNDAEIYSNPKQLQPGRWVNLGRKPRLEEAAQFGGGPHFCLGYHLALLEGTQFIVKVAQLLHQQNLRLELVGDFPLPKYVPLMRPPEKAKIRLRNA